jgi:hypothetical protein
MFEPRFALIADTNNACRWPSSRTVLKVRCMLRMTSTSRWRAISSCTLQRWSRVSRCWGLGRVRYCVCMEGWVGLFVRAVRMRMMALDLFSLSEWRWCIGCERYLFLFSRHVVRCSICSCRCGDVEPMLLIATFPFCVRMRDSTCVQTYPNPIRSLRIVSRGNIPCR